MKCGYLERDEAAALYQVYDSVIATIVGMINHSHTWTIPSKR